MASALKIPTIFSAIDKMSPVLDKIEGKVGGVIKKMNGVATKGAMAATLMAGGLAYSANSAIQFEDRMSDVAKTTGLAGKELDDYGGKILDISKTTRTSIEDLQKIGAIGGQLGIARTELSKFTDSANKFAVALGGDYAGGVEEAIVQVGKINNLFKDTRKLNPAESIQRAGSAINELTNIGATAQNMNDFVLRMGALPDAIKPAYTSTVALASAMELAGVDAQIGASGLGALLSKAGNNLPLFAKQMKMTTKEATKLFNTDTADFAIRFANSFKGMKADQVSKKLKELGINSNEVQKVVGALGAQNENLTQSFKDGPSIMQRSIDAFIKMNSINDEAAVKESTTAAKIQQAQNNLEQLSITVGTQLLPELNKLIPDLVKLIQKFSDFSKENEWLVPLLVKATAALYGFKILMVGLPAAIAAVNFMYGAYIALMTKGIVTTTASKAAIMGFNVAMKAQLLWLGLVKAATWLWNAALYANPVGLIVAAILILIGIIVACIYYWDEWGAAVLQFMGPIGMVVNMIMTFRKYWDLIVKAFKEEGIVGGLKKIQQVMWKALLIPVRQLLNLLAKIPGLGKLATKGLGGLDKVEMRLGTDKLDTELANLNRKPNVVSSGVLASENQKKDKDKGKLEIDLKAPDSWGVNTKTSGNFGMPINLNPSFNGN